MVRGNGVLKGDKEGGDLARDCCSLISESEIKNRRLLIVSATIPCRNAVRVQELEALVVKPVNKSCGPGRCSSVREGPDRGMCIKVAHKECGNKWVKFR